MAAYFIGGFILGAIVATAPWIWLIAFLCRNRENIANLRIYLERIDADLKERGAKCKKS